MRENPPRRRNKPRRDDAKRASTALPNNQSDQAALRERVKELTCLYGIAQVAGRPGAPLDRVLQEIVQLLPPAWQYPETAQARIVLDGRAYSTPGFREAGARQAAQIVVNGGTRGVIEVVYLQARPAAQEGPFLKEERSLIDAVSRQVALVIERREAEDDKLWLRDQLMHADRLATIGQLAASVAHEINEPLGNILGFAQLARKCPGLPNQASHDVQKIVTASLHAREVIKKLLGFARQTPPKKALINLNQVVEEGLYFFQGGCAKTGIELVRSLSADLPDIVADPVQLSQVLVNLVVNAMQAMPKGGKLTVTTSASDGCVSLIVEDTGIGMSQTTVRKIFQPFFTTKGDGQGTGLGLPIVQSIVSAHGGSIKVQSRPGRGTRFEIRLPIQSPKPEKDGDGDPPLDSVSKAPGGTYGGAPR